MKKTMITILAFALVFAVGFLSVDTTQAKPACKWEVIDPGCCISVGWLLQTWCCVAPDGTYLECKFKKVRDYDACPPGCNIC